MILNIRAGSFTSTGISLCLVSRITENVHEPIGVDLTSAEGILYGTVNSVVTGDKTVDEWYNAVIDAVKKYDK